MIKLDQFYYDVATDMYTKLENYSKSNTQSRIFARSIIKSSQKSIVTILDK